MIALHQLYSVVFIPIQMVVNMKVGGRIPKRMTVWVSISFLNVQQTLGSCVIIKGKRMNRRAGSG